MNPYREMPPTTPEGHARVWRETTSFRVGGPLDAYDLSYMWQDVIAAGYTRIAADYRQKAAADVSTHWQLDELAFMEEARNTGGPIFELVVELRRFTIRPQRKELVARILAQMAAKSQSKRFLWRESDEQIIIKMP